MKTVFLSAGIGAWYPAGVDRLRATLLEQQWPHDIKIWRDEWPDARFPQECPYTMKAAAFQWALDNEYETVIWGDASIMALKPLDSFVETINAKGYWIGQSGYNCAQVCGDRMLDYFGVTRDEAENMHDTATGLFGVNVSNPVVRVLIETWIKAGRDGAFAGGRGHEGQSLDPRFCFGRQDQAAMSVCIGKLGLPLFEMSVFVGFKWDSKDGKLFACEGM